jgi:hypothetical protein
MTNAERYITFSSLHHSTQLEAAHLSQHRRQINTTKSPNIDLSKFSVSYINPSTSSFMSSSDSSGDSPSPLSTPAMSRDTRKEAPQAPDAKVLTLQTKISFCLPTSLAFFNNLTWYQTPWAPRSTLRRTTSPISASDAHTISNHLDVSQEAIQNALYFGSHPTGPDLYVVFPHATTRVATNEHFLTIWHDQIVKPAFDRAWKDSGLVKLYGAEVDGQTRILPPTGVRTNMDALPAKGFMDRLRNGRPGSVSVDWPSANMKVMNEAWQSMTGMIRGHPDLQEFQTPVLLAVYWADIYFTEGLSARKIHRHVGKAWDKWVDAQFAVSRSLRVVLEVGIGLEAQVQESRVGHAIGRTFKRMAEESDEEDDGNDDEDDEGHRNKRCKEL